MKLGFIVLLFHGFCGGKQLTSPFLGPTTTATPPLAVALFDQGSDQVNVKFSVHTGWPNGYCSEKATTCWKARLEQFELKRADFNAENIVIMGKTSQKKLALTIGL